MHDVSEIKFDIIVHRFELGYLGRHLMDAMHTVLSVSVFRSAIGLLSAARFLLILEVHQAFIHIPNCCPTI